MEKKCGGTGLTSKKVETLETELNERAKQPSAVNPQEAIFFQCMNSVLVDQKFQSRCLVHKFSFTDIFSNIKNGYRAAILNKNSM